MKPWAIAILVAIPFTLAIHYFAFSRIAMHPTLQAFIGIILFFLLMGTMMAILEKKEKRKRRR